MSGDKTIDIFKSINLQETYEYVRKIFFPRWDKKKKLINYLKYI